MRKISRWLVGEHLELVTICWFDDHDLPADRIEEYDDLIEQIRIRMTGLGQAEELKLGMELILSDPKYDCEPLNGGQYGFTSDEMRAILARVYRRLWPTAPYPPARPADAELTNETWDEWRRQQGHVVHRL